MSKLTSTFVLLFALLVSGYIGGASFSFIFIILDYELASIISFAIGVLAGMAFVLVLLSVITHKISEDEEVDQKHSALANKCSAVYKNTVRYNGWDASRN
jgi:hypothetical protein